MYKAKEYCVKILLNPQKISNKDQFYWSILGFVEDKWCNICNGWEDSIDKAWESAYKNCSNYLTKK